MSTPRTPMTSTPTPKASDWMPAATARTRSHVDTETTGHAAVWTRRPVDTEHLAHAVARCGVPQGGVPHRVVPVVAVPHGAVPGGCVGLPVRGVPRLASPPASVARRGAGGAGLDLSLQHFGTRADGMPKKMTPAKAGTSPGSWTNQDGTLNVDSHCQWLRLRAQAL